MTISEEMEKIKGNVKCEHEGVYDFCPDCCICAPCHKKLFSIIERQQRAIDVAMVQLKGHAHYDTVGEIEKLLEGKP